MPKCDLCHETGNGRLHGMYPTVVQDDVRYKRVLKACAVCVEQFVTGHSDELYDKLRIDFVAKDRGCFACGHLPLNGQSLKRFYLTAYGDKNTRYDYQSRYCETCANSLIHDLGLTNAQ